MELEVCFQGLVMCETKNKNLSAVVWLVLAKKWEFDFIGQNSKSPLNLQPEMRAGFSAPGD